MTTALLEKTVAEPHVFTLNDRCDADKGSRRSDGKGVGIAEQAFYRVTKGDFELFLCIHHYRQHEAALVTDGWNVQESDAVAEYGVKNYIYSEQ